VLVATGAQGLIGGLDLPHGRVGFRAVIGAIRDQHHRDALIAITLRPVERTLLTRTLLKRGVIGRDRLLEPRRPTLPLGDQAERAA
jgi:hypothetical protein